jgi:hypothetical protein
MVPLTEEESEPMTYGESFRPRLGVILAVGSGVVAGGFIGATAGIFVTMPLLARYIGPPLSWLLGVVIGGGLGGSVGCYIMLRLVRREIC